MRQYAIRDRIFYPLTEQEKLALQLEKESEEAKKLSEDHKTARRALKTHMKFRTPRPLIEQAGTKKFRRFSSPCGGFSPDI